MYLLNFTKFLPLFFLYKTYHNCMVCYDNTLLSICNTTVICTLIHVFSNYLILNSNMKLSFRSAVPCLNLSLILQDN
jgi:hypothetical protein